MKNPYHLKLGLFIVVFVLLASNIHAYTVLPGEEAHQHITKEAQDVWKLIPRELEDHLTNPITRTTSDHEYNSGDDIIDGSREEDLPLLKAKFLMDKFHWSLTSG